MKISNLYIYKMVKSYCIREKQQTDSVNEQYIRAKNGRLMLKSICVSCRGKKSKFIKSQEGGFLSDMLFKLGAKGLYNGAKLAASHAIKSDFAKDKMKNVANKYLDQILDNVTSDISNKLNPLKGSGFDIHKLIGKLPKPKKGWTPGKYKYMGPYNPLQKQLEHDEEGNITKWHQQPYNEVDAIAAQHDVDYTICSKKNQGRKCKNDADRKMIQSLHQIPYGSMPKWGQTARFLINTKQKLGMGNTSKNYLSRRVGNNN